MAVAPNIDWHDKLSSAWLLWDTSAIIKVIQHEGQEIFDELRNIDTLNVYISPIELELLATKQKVDKLQRSEILASQMSPMPFTIKHLDMAKRLQAVIGSIAQPSAADLYIGSTLAVSGSTKFFMITHNIKDFPGPFFKKECYITLYTNLGVCSLAVLSFDKTSLITEGS